MKYDPDTNTYTATSHFDFIGWDVLKGEQISGLTVKVVIRRKGQRDYFTFRPGFAHWVEKPNIRTVISHLQFVPFRVYNVTLIPPGPKDIKP